MDLDVEAHRDGYWAGNRQGTWMPSTDIDRHAVTIVAVILCVLIEQCHLEVSQTRL
jgi:hypothetical protein